MKPLRKGWRMLYLFFINKIGFKNALIQKVISNSSAKYARCLVRLSSPISDFCPAACGPAYVWHTWIFLTDLNGQCMGIDTSRVKMYVRSFSNHYSTTSGTRSTHSWFYIKIVKMKNSKRFYGKKMATV